MKHDFLISIVIPVYNRGDVVGRCLDSMAAQDGIDRCRIIVVDNNSVDDSVAAVTHWSAEHPEIALVQTSENIQSAAAARNAGLKLVDSPFVMFFDSDDIMLPGHIRRLIDGINANPAADIFGWGLTCEQPDGSYRKAPFLCDRPMRDHIINSSLSTQRIAVRTDFIRAIGSWDETLLAWDDFELGVRLVAAHPTMVKLEDPSAGPLVKTFYSDNSITGNCFSVSPSRWEDALDRMEKTLASVCPEELSALACRRAILAGHYAREGAIDEAKRLRSVAVAPGFGRFKSWMTYMTARHAGRGTRLMAHLLLG